MTQNVHLKWRSLSIYKKNIFSVILIEMIDYDISSNVRILMPSIILIWFILVNDQTRRDRVYDSYWSILYFIIIWFIRFILINDQTRRDRMYEERWNRSRAVCKVSFTDTPYSYRGWLVGCPPKTFLWIFLSPGNHTKIHTDPIKIPTDYDCRDFEALPKSQIL